MTLETLSTRKNSKQGGPASLETLSAVTRASTAALFPVLPTANAHRPGLPAERQAAITRVPVDSLVPSPVANSASTPSVTRGKKLEENNRGLWKYMGL